MIRLIFKTKVEDNVIRNGLEMEIGQDGNTKVLSIKQKDPDHQALQLHSMQTGSESFLQMVIQIYFMVLLVVMGGATLIAGREAEDFFNDICKILLLSFALVIFKDLIGNYMKAMLFYSYL